MSAPPQAVVALVWALVGPPLLVYAATRVRRGQARVHAALMVAWVVVELAVFVSFMFVMTPSPRRAELEAVPLFTVHLAFAVATFIGMTWQLASRAHPRLRPRHRHTGPNLGLVGCLARVTGIFNYRFM
jgi:hypothetical protein